MDTNSIYESARNNKTFKSVLNGLIINQFCLDYDYPQKSIKLTEPDIRKAGFLASILALSEIENHRFIAASFAKLLYLQNKLDEPKTQLAYTILSRTGNLAATELLKSLFINDSPENNKKLFKRNFGIGLDMELGTKRNINKVKVETNNKTYFVTDFQKKLWESLQINNHVAISAPTSAGKSLFTQQFIGTLIIKNDEFKVIYIVPSKALISQVSDDFKELFREHRDVVVKTAFIDREKLRHKRNKTTDNTNEEIVEKKVIYCVTPERCLKLLQEGWKNLFKPDLVFIDEIQKVETDDNRGVLLEYVLSEVTKMWSDSKILTAGPFIKNNTDLFKELLDIPAEDISTFLPPVYQLRLTLQIVDSKKSKILIHLRKNETHAIELDEDISINIKSSAKSFLAPIILKFGKPDGNLVYAAKANWCEAYATEFIKHLFKKNEGRAKDLDQSVTDLIQFLKEEIHSNYFLIYCLQHKVAFHHGKLPDVVKNEIEYLFKEGHIEYLFCTSTLLEGVNLPAPRMFIVAAKKGSQSKDLTEFDFGNLIGRAGRIKNSLVGTIFCLEQKIDDNWSDKYYNAESYSKSVIPISKRTINGVEGSENILTAMGRKPKDLKHKGNEYTGNLIKHKYLANPNSVIPYLTQKGLDNEKATAIFKSLEIDLKDSTIKSEIARLNPSIDPVLQNILYEKIKVEELEKWVLIDDENGNANYNRYMTKAEGRELPYEQKPFYYQFEHLFLEMDNIFAIWKEAMMKRANITSMYQMIFHGANWLNSMPLYTMINNAVENDKLRFEHEWVNITTENKLERINKCINVVISNNQTVVTYILVKYAKLLVDILESKMTQEQKEKYHRTLSLPTMLELGTRKIDVLIMIAIGIPRSLALKISKHIPEFQRDKPIEWLANIITLRELPLRKFYIKYLLKRGYLPKLNKESVDLLYS